MLLHLSQITRVLQPSIPRPAKAHSLQLVPKPLPLRHSPLEMWHLLSLDAPCVAAVWTVAAARSVGVALPAVDPVAMFLAVWMLYAADRLLDAAPLSKGAATHETCALEARHLFHHRHRRGFVAVLGVAAVVLAVLLIHMEPVELRYFAVLAALLAGWLLLVHGLAVERSHRLPKEFAVGVFFPAAVFIPALAHLREDAGMLLPAALSFAAVCSLNCLFLYAWEHPRDWKKAHPSTRWALRRLVPLSIGTLGVTLLLSLRGFHEQDSQPLFHPGWLPLLACFSAGALLALHLARGRIAALQLRALADVALLVPAPVLLWLALLQKGRGGPRR